MIEIVDKEPVGLYHMVSQPDHYRVILNVDAKDWKVLKKYIQNNFKITGQKHE